MAGPLASRGLGRHGRFVMVATAGDYGKPRLALVVQNDLFADLLSVVVCPLTTTLRDDADQFRIDVMPTQTNGLREPSQIAIDKMTVVPVTKIGAIIGAADDTTMLRVGRALALFLAMA